MAPWQQHRKPGSRLGRWFFLSLVLHAEVVLILGLAAYFWTPRNADLAVLTTGGTPDRIAISTLDDETVRQVLKDLDRKREEQEEEQAKDPPRAPGQVVELPVPLNQERPEHARFAAEHDSSVEKETKKYGKFDKNARQGDAQGTAVLSRPAVPEPLADARRRPGPAARPAERTLALRGVGGPAGRPSTPGVSEPATATSLERPGDAVEVAPAPDGEFALKGGKTLLLPRGALPGAPPASNPSIPIPAPNLLPSPQQLARAFESGTQDYLRDVEEGDETSLNAKEWKFASFFNRVKNQVRAHWNPGDEYRRRDPTGAIYGQKDRYTLLRIQLKPNGTLANVALELPSGVEFLDDEAIEAFKRAEPFPNPPRQLIDAAQGTVSFRFGFFLELSRAPQFKMFRYNSL
jgi:TonB family protein